MKTSENITLHLPKSIFWDVEPNSLEWDSDRNYIITRVFMFANSTNYKLFLEILEKVYTKQQIYNSIQNSNEYLRLNMLACNKVAEDYQIEILFTAEKVKSAQKNNFVYFKRNMTKREMNKIREARLD